MATINPNDEKYKKGSGDRMQRCGNGTKDFAAIGFEHLQINGKSAVEIRSVCLYDTTPQGDVGKELRDCFFLHSEAALGRIAKFARDGLGWSEPFDPEKPDELRRVLQNRPFRATVQCKQRGKYTDQDTGWSFEAPGLPTDPATGRYSMSPAMQQAMARAQKSWEGYLAWRAKNPRGAAGSWNGGGGGGGSWGGGSSGGGGGGQYDDVPFGLLIGLGTGALLAGAQFLHLLA